MSIFKTLESDDGCLHPDEKDKKKKEISTSTCPVLMMTDCSGLLELVPVSNKQTSLSRPTSLLQFCLGESSPPTQRDAGHAREAQSGF